IWFGTDVARVEPADDPDGGPPRWDVTVKGSRGGAPRPVRCGAVGARPEAPEGGPPRWDVTVRGSRGGAPRTMRYAAVVAANGHNWSPKMPEYDGLAHFHG